jgi:putative peptidoglycan lipid II flippase
MTTILIIICPVGTIFYFFGVPLIQILLERGAFTHEITIAVYSTFVILLGAFIFQSLGNIIMRILYLSKMTVIATIIAFIEIIAYLLSGLWLSKYYSYKGLAIAQSLSTGLTFLFSMIIINKRLLKIDLSSINIFIKIILSNIAMFMFLLLLNIFWCDINNVYAIILKICSGITLMYSLLLIFKVQEVMQIKNLIKIKINKIINNNNF